MKNLLLIGAFLLGMAVNTKAQFVRARLQATGLTCAMCSNAINKALKTKSFIESITPDIKNSSFDIVFKKDADVDIDGIRQAVEDAGFSVGSLQLTANFDQLKVEDDEHVKFGNKNFHFIRISSQTLTGERTIQMAEKDFLTPRLYKKYSDASRMKCFHSGRAESCCTGMAAGSRVYQVTI